MSTDNHKHPGLNLGHAHGKDDDEAKHMVFGFWIFLMSDAILFALAMATYATALDKTAGGPGPADLYDLGSVFIQTLVLLTSSLTFGMASMALKFKKGTPKLIAWLALTLLLGLIFLTLECQDLAAMVGKGGVPSRSGFLSAFWGVVPLHGLHVAAGCLWLVCLLGQIARHGVDARVKHGLLRLALFWHFLDIVWIAVFSGVYLARLA